MISGSHLWQGADCVWAVCAQDVPQLARLLLTVLVEDSLRLRLASAARATALQFAPSVIADRCSLLSLML